MYSVDAERPFDVFQSKDLPQMIVTFRKAAGERELVLT